MNMTSGILFGLLVMLGHGIGTAISKVPAQNIGSLRSVFYRNLVISAIILISLPFFESSFSIKYFLLALGTALIGYIALAVFYRAIKTGKVGVVAPISNSSGLVTVVLALLFYEEMLSMEQIISVTLIFLGIVLISINFLDFKNSNLFQFSSGIILAILCAILWGTMYFFLKIPIINLGPLFATFILEFGILMLSLVHIKTQGIELKISITDYKYMLLVGIFGAIGIISYSFGVKVSSNVSVITAMSMANPVVSAIYARFVYKEKLTLQQLVGAFIVVFGIIGLGIF